MGYWERLGRALGLLVLVATLSAASAGGGLVPTAPTTALDAGAPGVEGRAFGLASEVPHHDLSYLPAGQTATGQSPAAKAGPGDPPEAGGPVVIRPQPVIQAHVVGPGETLSTIADHYGVTVRTIAQSCGLANPNHINPGQTLIFPSVDGVLHRVRPGDTIYGLAERYAAEAPEIAWANHIEDPRSLEVGSLLIIPGGRIAQVTIASSAGSARASGSGGLSWPLRGPITSYYGPRWGGQHTGIDIAGSYGASVRAAGGGEVTMAAWYGRYGRTIIVSHGDGLSTLYAHASELLVTVGQTVVAGEIIARVGSTGNSTGPHLHFEVRIGDECRNPLSFLPPSA